MKEWRKDMFVKLILEDFFSVVGQKNVGSGKADQ